MTTETETQDFTKIVRVGTMKTYGGRVYSVFCNIEYREGCLSISGVEGPTRGGNCLSACGQINRTLIEAHKDHSLTINTSGGWNAGKLVAFLSAWDHYHLNDLQAGCEHQRAEGRTYQKDRGHVCEECDPPYEIGTAWKRMEVPEDVLAFLRELPDTDRKPAWV